MLVKRKPTAAARGAGMFGSVAAAAPMDRRAFLKRSGLAAGGLAAAGAVSSMSMVGKAEAGPTTPGVEIVRKKSICTHCSVGCTVIAEVQNGVWVGQEPTWDSPINHGTHCAKGAAVRELVHGDRRLKYPMKLVGGEWKRMSWDQAIEEIGAKLLEIREKSGAGLRVLAGLGQVLQRGGLPVPQVGGVLGHQHGRPPGAHLPLHHGRRRSEYLGLRRHDQQLQRHPQLQGDHDHRRQPGRGASGLAAARAARQGAEPGAPDRHRSALHPHRGARDRVCPAPPGHRHPADLGHALAHLREWLGGQGVSSASASTAWRRSAPR